MIFGSSCKKIDREFDEFWTVFPDSRGHLVRHAALLELRVEGLDVLGGALLLLPVRLVLHVLRELLDLARIYLPDSGILRTTYGESCEIRRFPIPCHRLIILNPKFQNARSCTKSPYLEARQASTIRASARDRL